MALKILREYLKEYSNYKKEAYMKIYEKYVITTQELDYLRNTDEKMRKLIDIVGDIDRGYIPNPFIALLNSIVYQQLSYKAAMTIWGRFEKLVEEITPKKILSHSDEEFRECGLSKTKVRYIKNIANAVLEGKLNLDHIYDLSNEEIVNQLIAIKGIGIWTAEMFLIFSLCRKDIISYGDLGIRRGIKWLYGLENEPTKEEFILYKDRYSPNNTLASFYLWEITIKNLFKYDNIEGACKNIPHN